MEQLSAMDAAFLYIEGPTLPQHVLGIMLLDAAGSGGAYSPARFRRVLEERMHLMPAFQRKLVEVPLHADFPYWVHDDDVDLDAHLRQVTCPAPGDLPALGRLVGEFGSTPLRRDRPLWELLLVDGLASGQVALVAKIHHSTLYGAAGADTMAQLLDLGPEGREVEPAPDLGAEQQPSAAGLLARAVLHSAQRPVRTARNVAGSLGRLGRIADVAAAAVTRRAPVSLPFSAPRTPLNGRMTANRQAAFTKVDFADLQTIKNAFETKINDVVLAAVTQSLRGYLLERNLLPGKPMLAAVPIKGGDGQVTGTDVVSALSVPLPVQTADPVEQLRQVAELSRHSKGLHDVLGTGALGGIAELVPPLVLRGGSRLYDGLGLSRLHPPIVSLVVSNMPGPPIPLYCAGAKVDAVYPFGPLLPGAGLNVTVLSNMGSLDVGLFACPDLVPELWDLADRVPEAVATLLEAARASFPAERATA